MAGIDLTSHADALKLRYSEDFFRTMAYRENKTLMLIPKDENFRKHKYVQPINYSNPQSISPTFSQAQTQAGSTSQELDRFEVPHTRMYGVITVDDLLLEMAKGGDKDLFYSTFVSKADGILHATGRALQKAIHGDGYGSLGRVSSPGASTTLTLSDPADVTNFEIGQTLVLSASNNGDALRNSGATGVVTGVNRNAGTLTFGSNVTTIWAAAADGDYIFPQGWREDSGTPSRQIVTGINAYVVPSDGTASSNLHGVDQTADTRLAGVNYDGSGDTVYEAIMEGGHRCNTNGGSPDVCIINPRQYSNLVKELHTMGVSREMVRIKAKDADVSFQAMTFNIPSGDISVVVDRDCQRKYAKLLQLNTWKCVSMGVAPRILNPDGLDKLRGSSSNDVEIRVGYYANLVCKAPGWNAIITLPT